MRKAIVLLAGPGACFNIVDTAVGVVPRGFLGLWIVEINQS